MQPFVIAYLAVVTLLSLVTFATFGWDKWRARREGWRVPERTLHILTLLGGWPGALLGQRWFRHKTQKISYRIVFWLCVLAHVGAVVAIVYWAQSGD